MADKDSRLTAIKGCQCSLDQFAHLQHGRPHGSLTTGDRSPSFAIIKQFMHDDGAAQSQQSQLETADFKETTVVFVHDEEIFHSILAGTELFQDTDVFAGPPGGVDGDVELHLIVEEEKEL